MIGVLTKAAYGNIYIESHIRIYHAEWNRASRAIFIAHNFLDIKIVHPLVLASVTTKGKTFTNTFKHGFDIIFQITTENRRLCRRIIGIFARLGTKVNHLALLNDNHALTIINGNDGTRRDNIILRTRIRTAFLANALLPLCYENILI